MIVAADPNQLPILVCFRRAIAVHGAVNHHHPDAVIGMAFHQQVHEFIVRDATITFVMDDDVEVFGPVFSRVDPYFVIFTRKLLINDAPLDFSPSAFADSRSDQLLLHVVIVTATACD